MKPIELAPETESRNYFEKYLQLIEKLRLDYTEEKILLELNLLEKIIVSIEAIQKEKIELLKSKTYQKYLNDKINEFIKNWYCVFQYSNEAIKYTEGCNYNFLAALNALTLIGENYFDDPIKYFIKLNPNKGTILYLTALNVISENEEIHSKRNKHSSLLKIISLLEEQQRNNSSGPLSLSIASKGKVLQGVSKELGAFQQKFYDDLNNTFKEITGNFEQNIFKFEYRDYHHKDISEIISRARNLDLIAVFENFFRLTKENEYFEWTIQFFWGSQKKFNAKNISYLIWSFCSAFEVIEDIDIYLEDWGSGSKWADLKMKIKSEAAKVDALSLTKRIRQLIQSHYAKTSLEQIQKEDAETQKIKKETEVLTYDHEKKKELYDIKTEMDLYERALEIQKKEQEIEKQKLENTEKKLNLIEKSSQLVKNGILEQDSELHTYINDVLFFASSRGNIHTSQINSLNEIEAGEQKKLDQEKGDSPSI
jgi:hypothetical protein